MEGDCNWTSGPCRISFMVDMNNSEDLEVRCERCSTKVVEKEFPTCVAR